MAVSRILIYEKNTDGNFNETPIIYEVETDNIDDAKFCSTEMIWQAIEIEGLDDSEMIVEFEVEENGEYVDRDEYFVTAQIVRTDEQSNYSKHVRIRQIDRENSKIFMNDNKKVGE